MAHWELLTPDRDKSIYDELRDKDGHKFSVPIASTDARQEDHNAHTPKLNYKDKFDRPPFIQSVLYPEKQEGILLLPTIMERQFMRRKLLMSQFQISISSIW